MIVCCNEVDDLPTDLVSVRWCTRKWLQDVLSTFRDTKALTLVVTPCDAACVCYRPLHCARNVLKKRQFSHSATSWGCSAMSVVPLRGASS